ncbi:MAG TPA: LptF/LptG family permease [Chitinophagales bacterium]|nr:LptF/LptG family permease [Chitinophagales bacterium]HMU69443.1 LptF/LptG family permease [Chitinophagales bacterium]HMX05163.1 LptF/LptG family permease [Chitinophagales bacterium]HMZ89644.1 LptF/LptG family permease [Chitinophagales bacterium]HNA59070.1 LptF/LptG family permease [Chitinophagales bacterium]
MTKIDKYIIKSFLGPFIISFIIALIIFLMIFLWKYIEDLVGKGLEWYVIMKLLFYASANMVPLALPIAVLLACIMTYGNLGERLELAALKSAGLSMFTFMRSTLLIGVFIAIGAYFFNNYVLPSAYLKFVVSLVDITKQKPALNIKPNEFYNEIDGYSILIGGKSDDNVTIHEVTIYEELDHSNDNVLIAESGKMQTTSDNNNLVFSLKNGKQYEQLAPTGKGKRHVQHVRMHFAEWNKSLDLSGFQMTHTSEELYQNHFKMLNTHQLSHAIDSLKTNNNNQAQALAPTLRVSYLQGRAPGVTFNDTAYAHQASSFIELIPLAQRLPVIKKSLQSVRTQTGYTNQVLMRMKNTRTKINSHLIELNRKYTLPLSCLLFVFIGAPLGAIIRKGGFGLPVLLSIIIFIFYYVLNITGEKMAEQSALSPFVGMWLSSFILVPICVFLTIKAKNDAPIVDGEWYYNQLVKLKGVFSKIKS